MWISAQIGDARLAALTRNFAFCRTLAQAAAVQIEVKSDLVDAEGFYGRWGRKQPRRPEATGAVWQP